MGALNDFFQSPFLGYGVSAISTGMQTAEAYRTAQAQNYANELNAMSLDQEVELATIQADTLRKLGSIAANDTRREYDTLRGDMGAAYAGSGVSVNAGSPAAVIANAAVEGVYEANKVKTQYELEAWGKDREAANLGFKASATRSGSVNPWLSASKTAVSGLSGMYDSLSRITSITKKRS